MTLLCPECKHILRYDGSRRLYYCTRCSMVTDAAGAVDTGSYTIRCRKIEVLKRELRYIKRVLTEGKPLRAPKGIKEATFKRVDIPTLKALGLIDKDLKLTPLGEKMLRTRSTRGAARLLLREVIPYVESQLEALPHCSKSRKELSALRNHCNRVIKRPLRRRKAKRSGKEERHRRAEGAGNKVRSSVVLTLEGSPLGRV